MAGQVIGITFLLPDGRQLSVKGSLDQATYELADVEVSREDALTAWEAQPRSWQRGRSLDDAIKTTIGR